MDGDYYTTGQGGNEWAYVGFLYRLNYNYKSRYLAEVSGRYDASSKFPENQQWGFFPSGSLGWRISEEPFMKSTRNWLDNLKVRASVGSLGNGNVSPYLYLSTIPIKKTVISSALLYLIKSLCFTSSVVCFTHNRYRNITAIIIKYTPK